MLCHVSFNDFFNAHRCRKIATSSDEHKQLVVKYRTRFRLMASNWQSVVTSIAATGETSRIHGPAWGEIRADLVRAANKERVLAVASPWF